MAWLRQGTVNVTNGSIAVVGVGTNWLSTVNISDMFSVDGDTFYEVLSITDDTHLTLNNPYLGTTATGVVYLIINIQPRLASAQLNVKLATLLNSWQVRENEFANWQGGSATGGPGSDGYFPLTNASGVTTLVACPAKLQQIAGTNGHVSVTWASTINLNLNTGSEFSVTFAGNTTVNLSGGSNGQVATLRITQDVNGSRLWTPGSMIRFGTTIPLGATALSTGAGKTDVITFMYSSVSSTYLLVAFAAGF
jgi:hypothetical protein